MLHFTYLYEGGMLGRIGGFFGRFGGSAAGQAAEQAAGQAATRGFFGGMVDAARNRAISMKNGISQWGHDVVHGSNNWKGMTVGGKDYAPTRAGYNELKADIAANIKGGRTNDALTSVENQLKDTSFDFDDALGMAGRMWKPVGATGSVVGIPLGLGTLVNGGTDGINYGQAAANLATGGLSTLIPGMGSGYDLEKDSRNVNALNDLQNSIDTSHKLLDMQHNQTAANMAANANSSGLMGSIGDFAEEHPLGMAAMVGVPTALAAGALMNRSNSNSRNVQQGPYGA